MAFLFSTNALGILKIEETNNKVQYQFYFINLIVSSFDIDQSKIGKSAILSSEVYYFFHSCIWYNFLNFKGIS